MLKVFFPKIQISYLQNTVFFIKYQYMQCISYVIFYFSVQKNYQLTIEIGSYDPLFILRYIYLHSNSANHPTDFDFIMLINKLTRNAIL